MVRENDDCATSSCQQYVSERPSFMMVLTGVGTYAYTRTDGVTVVPISALGV